MNPATKPRPDARVTSGEIRGLCADIRAASRDARAEHEQARANLGGVGEKIRNLCSELKGGEDAEGGQDETAE